MPKTSIYFSKTKIYKIVCKDVSIPDLYVRHTTNLIKGEEVIKTLVVKKT